MKFRTHILDVEITGDDSVQVTSVITEAIDDDAKKWMPPGTVKTDCIGGLSPKSMRMYRSLKQRIDAKKDAKCKSNSLPPTTIA